MIDQQPTEVWLRETFVDDANQAPVVEDLASAARHRAGQARRRRFAIGAAVIAAAAVVIGVAIVRPDLNAEGTHPVEPIATTSPVEIGPALAFRGVIVPVPKSMLRPDAVRCGTPVKDAAYWYDDGVTVELCGFVPEHPEELTTVLLTATDLPNTETLDEGTAVLDDGRTQIVTTIAARDVRLVVTSPDPERAASLTAGVQLLDAPDGCAVVDPEDSPRWSGRTNVNSTAKEYTGGVVCGYNDGWLTESAPLNQEEAASLAATINASALFEPKDCFDRVINGTPGPTDDELREDGYWLVRLTTPTEPVTFWVHGGVCSWAIDSRGVTRGVTNAMASELWQYTAGPDFLSGPR